VSQTPSTHPVGSAAVANAALAGEHAAIYAFGVVGAHLGPTEQPLAAAAINRHRARRDALAAAIVAVALATPAPAEPAYLLPFPIRTRADALRLAALVEDRLAALYVALVIGTSEVALRSMAASALQGSAADAAGWRLRAGSLPVTVAFPGR
jgi:Domain of unknown function (DUF4439)